jgi:hypothetical protein
MTRTIFRSALAFMAVAAVGMTASFAAPYTGLPGTGTGGYGNNMNNNNSKPPEPPPKPEPVVVKFMGAQRARLGGYDVMVIAGTEVLTGKQRQFGVENDAPQDKNKPTTFSPKAYVADVVKGLKPGDYLKVESKLTGKDSVYWADKVETYIPAEHEEEAGVYIWDGGYKDTVEKTDVYKIELTKFAKRYVCYAPMIAGEKGKGMAPDQSIVDAADAIDKAAKANQGKEREKKKFAVEATITGQGQAMFVASLDVYQPQKHAKFGKVVDADVAGQKGQAVELDEDGKTVTALLPGKLMNKRWVTDPQLLAEAKRLKAGVPVVFKTREAEGKSYLRQLALAPKETVKKETAASSGLTLPKGKEPVKK